MMHRQQSRKVFRSVFMAWALLLFVIACGSEAKALINVTADGVAIKGYDPVAYFLEGRPVKGLSEFEYTWQGAVWRLATEEHLELFKAAPEKYAPQYGGY